MESFGRPICGIHRIRERNETYEYYVNCKHTNEMKVWSSQLCLRFKQSQLSPKNVFGASTGFQPMASALALQCSTNWAIKNHTLGIGQFVEFIVPVKGMNHMNIMWTAKRYQQRIACCYENYLQRLEQAHFLVSQLRRSISRVLRAPTFKRIDFKSEGNLDMIVLFEQHDPPAFAYFWLHLNWAN